jgi:hypothetical protein
MKRSHSESVWPTERGSGTVRAQNRVPQMPTLEVYVQIPELPRFLNGPRRDRTCDPLIKSPAKTATATETHRQLPRISRLRLVRSWSLSAGVGGCSRTEHGQSPVPRPRWPLVLARRTSCVRQRPGRPDRARGLTAARAPRRGSDASCGTGRWCTGPD